MPKRNRHKELKRSGQIVVPAAVTKQEQDVKLFAESVRAQEAAERTARAAALEAVRRANRLDELTAAKATAVAELKSARSRGGGERVATAEAAYRIALAELQEFETGERPSWAPAAPVTEPTDAEPASDDTAESATEPTDAEPATD